MTVVLNRLDNIPEELKDIPAWCLWRLEERSGKKTKVPYDPRGKRASSTNPATWSTYAEVAQIDGYSGVGFFLSPEQGLVGVDLDDCFDGEKLTEIALKVVRAGSYSEFSPSGKGIRAFFYGRKPGSRCKSIEHKVEMYSAKRFLTITGNSLGDARRINKDQAFLDYFYKSIFPPAPPAILPSGDQRSPVLTDREIMSFLEACDSEGKWQALQNADSKVLSELYPASGNGGYDASSADSAACAKIAFYTQTPEQILRLWGKTKLAERDKFLRLDYQERTIAFVLSNLTSVFYPTETTPTTPTKTTPTKTTPTKTTPTTTTPTTTTPTETAPTETAPTETAPTETAPTVFPLDVFPAVYQEHCRAIANSVCCALDYPAATTLAVAAALCGESTLEIKSSWKETTNLYLGIVGDTGSGKTPASQLVIKASVMALEKQLQEANKIKAVESKREQILWQKQMTAYKRQKKAHDSEPPEEPEPMRPSEIHMNDTTTEALSEVMSHNPKGVFLVKDELTGWIRSLDQYKESGKGVDREFYLSAFSGDPIKVSRKGKEPLLVEHPRIVIFGGTVPEKLSDLVGTSQDGFAERILFSYPASIRRTWSDQEISPDLFTRVSLAYLSLRDNQAIKLSPGAKKHLVKFYNETFTPGYAGYKPKLMSLTTRFALILSKMHGETICTERRLQDAIRLAEYFDAHIQKVLKEARVSQETRDVNKLVSYAQKKGVRELSIRDLVRAGIPGCPSAKVAREKCQELVDLEQAAWVDPTKRRIQFL